MSDVSLNELPSGAKLKNGEIEIVEYVNSNSFGIKYRARTADGDNVIVKEFFPADIAVRKDGGVIVRNAASAEELENLKSGFVAAAESLVALDNPNIANVREYFSENKTCYMVMDVVAGISLEEFAQSERSKPTPEQMTEMLVKLIRALHDIHAAGLLHRDIEPKNITIDANMEPYLFLDFGTFHDAPSKGTKAVSKIMSASNHYAAMELRANPDEHAPAVDIYSLAASFYLAISGTPPKASIKRVSEIAMGEGDPYIPIRGVYEGYKIGVLESIDMAMSVFVDDRIRSASEWLRHLNVDAPTEQVTSVRSLYRPAKKEKRVMKVPTRVIRPIAIMGAFGCVLFTLTMLIASAY